MAVLPINTNALSWGSLMARCNREPIDDSTLNFSYAHLLWELNQPNTYLPSTVTDNKGGSGNFYVGLITSVPYAAGNKGQFASFAENKLSMKGPWYVSYCDTDEPQGTGKFAFGGHGSTGNPNTYYADRIVLKREMDYALQQGTVSPLQLGTYYTGVGMWYDSYAASYQYTDGNQELPDGTYFQTTTYAEIFNDYKHNIAFGAYSHAEGNGTTTYGDYSHAEGLRTITYSGASHAEGEDTVTYGTASHAEGFNTVTYSWAAHAEGEYTVTYDWASHAEGEYTVAYGEASHAEGNGTTTYGNYSHAEGLSTITYGNYSHAEGLWTTAIREASHTEGLWTTAIGEASHTEGNETTAYGKASHTEGNGTTAYGKASHTEGNGTTAYGNSSHGEGYNSYAYGYASSAHNSSGAYGDFSTSFNIGVAYGAYSVAINASNASGKFSESGITGTALGAYSFAHGSRVIAYGAYSNAIGYNTKAYGYYSHAEGASTVAYGGASHTEGRNTVAYRDNSHSEGIYTIAYGWTSHAEGNSTIAYGDNSHSQNLITYAGGQASTAIGFDTYAMSSYSFTSGTYTISSYNEAEFSIGRYNVSYADSLFNIGIGTSNTDRKNAVDVRTSGVAYFHKSAYIYDPIINQESQIVSMSYLQMSYNATYNLIKDKTSNTPWFKYLQMSYNATYDLIKDKTSNTPWFKYGNGVFANIQTNISYANEHYPDLFDGDIVVGDDIYIKDSQTTALFGNLNKSVGGASNIISGQFNSVFNLTHPELDSTKNNLVVGQQNQAYTVGVNINTGEIAFDAGSYLERYDFSSNLVNGTKNYIVGNISNIISATNSYLFNNYGSLISANNNEFFGKTYIGKVYFKNDFPNTGDYCYTYIPNVNIDAVNIYPDKLDNDVFARTMLRVPVIDYYDKADINSRKYLVAIVSTYSYKNSNNELWSIIWTPYKNTTPFVYESGFAYTSINSFAENNRNSIIQGAANYVSNCTHAFVCGTYLVDIDNHDKVLLGQWNKIEDGNNNALTIGGGTGPRDRKNIFTIDTDGTTYTSKNFRIGDKSTSVSVLKKSPLPGNEIEYIWSGTQENYDALRDEVANHPDTLFIIQK